MSESDRQGGQKLTAERVVTALVENSLPVAAVSLGVSQRTLRRWRERPEVRDRLAAFRRDRLEEVTTELLNGALGDAKRLDELVHSDDERVALKAIEVRLKSVGDFLVKCDLAKRLDAALSRIKEYEQEEKRREQHSDDRVASTEVGAAAGPVGTEQPEALDGTLPQSGAPSGTGTLRREASGVAAGHGDSAAEKADSELLSRSRQGDCDSLFEPTDRIL
jgi:hypothetical protein